jgi:hypothetical protein
MARRARRRRGRLRYRDSSSQRSLSGPPYRWQPQRVASPPPAACGPLCAQLGTTLRWARRPPRVHPRTGRRSYRSRRPTSGSPGASHCGTRRSRTAQTVQAKGQFRVRTDHVNGSRKLDGANSLRERKMQLPANRAGRPSRIEGGCDRILWAGKHAGHIHRRSQSSGPVSEPRIQASGCPSRVASIFFLKLGSY